MRFFSSIERVGTGKNEEKKIIKMNFLTSANDRVTSFFFAKNLIKGVSIN
jgi:hypothetical protein